MTGPARRPWRKKKWRVAAAFWLTLPILYVLSVGPWTYAHARGWLPEPVIRTVGPVYAAFDHVLDRDLPGSAALRAYGHRAFQLGLRHAAAD